MVLYLENRCKNIMAKTCEIVEMTKIYPERVLYTRKLFTNNEKDMVECL